MTINIIEVIRRSDQGMTRPFICRGDDEETYFVKGIGAGRKSQISELVAGKLGLALGLPIAPFEIVEVPEELVEMDDMFETHDLGVGLAFGSRLHKEVMELTASSVPEIPEKQQQDVLAFDWWIRNEDRLLSENGGNPNLFFAPDSHELVVIDHNQAFDIDFNAENFLEFHVFSNQQQDLFSDILRRRQYNDLFSAALSSWEDIVKTVPNEWLFVDPEMTIPVDFDLNRVYQLLKRHEHKDFWYTT